MLLAPYFRPHLGPFWSTYNFGKGRDIEDRIGLIIGLKKYGLPPKNPFIYNQPLNYYYFYHLSAAILSSLGGKLIPPELSHLILSGTIMISAILLTSFFVRPLVLILLFLGYGFDFFMMIPALFKIYPYTGKLNHVDQWVAPFVQDLKVNPFSVWFTWVPHHSLALFLSLALVGIFFDSIKIKNEFKPVVLAFLFFAILGTSSYVFLGLLAVFFIFWLSQSFRKKKLLVKNYLFILISLPFGLILMIPTILRINVSTIGLYPFWSLPRDHLLSFKFLGLPIVVKIILLFFFLIERFLIYFLDLGLVFILAVFSWKRFPRTLFNGFVKIMFASSILISVLLRSTPNNNDLCYRISGFSWIAGAFLVNPRVEEYWQKIKKASWLLIFLMIVLFTPIVVEQAVFPNLNFDQEFWQMKKFVEQKIPQEAVIQSPPYFEPSPLYLLEREIVYSPSGLLYYPDPKQTRKTKKDMENLFGSTKEMEAKKIVNDYRIDFILTKTTDLFNNPAGFKKIFENQKYLIYKTKIE